MVGHQQHRSADRDPPRAGPHPEHQDGERDRRRRCTPTRRGRAAGGCATAMVASCPPRGPSPRAPRPGPPPGRRCDPAHDRPRLSPCCCTGVPRRVCSHGPRAELGGRRSGEAARPRQDAAAPAHRRASGAPAHDALVLALLADTVAAALACRAVASVLVVTDDPAARDVVRDLGARMVARRAGPRAEPGAGARLRRRGGPARSPRCPPTSRRCVPRSWRRRSRAAAGAPRCFVADAHGTGTTLLTALGSPLDPRFGRGSAARAPGLRRARPGGHVARPGPGRRHRGRPRRRGGAGSGPVHVGVHAAGSVRHDEPVTSGTTTDETRDPNAQHCPHDRFLNRELSWLDFNARVLELAEDETPAAAGAGEVPGDLREQPRRVLHGPHRRASSAGTAPGSRPLPRRADHPRAARAHRRPHPGPRAAARATRSSTTSRPGWRPRASGSCTGRTSTRRPPAGCASTSATRSSRCSPRSRSTRPTRSPTSAGCRSTSPSWSATPTAGSRTSPGSRCPTTCRGSSRSAGSTIDGRPSCRSRT